MSIKYYQLAKDEELPEEFCAVRDVNGEPSEYTWYERMSEFERELWVLFTQNDWFAGSEYRKLQAENAKLLEDNDRLVQAIEELHSVSLEDRLVQLENSNDKLREWCGELLHMAESNDPDFLHWPEIHDELRKAGVEIVQL